ncbi:hypothetical protein WDW37_01625 [Bdellovibrionota bacterium FG-1]
MAVHLYAPLNTRYIPILFTGMFALFLAAQFVHADEEEEATAPFASAPSAWVDRRPGFSPITYADTGYDSAEDRAPLGPPTDPQLDSQ